MSSELHEWLHLGLRWFHVVVGVLWIGQTAFFSWLDSRMRVEADAEGRQRVWMVHSGGFYLVEKQTGQTRPGGVPPTLHWFRWEAAASWVSGVLLLVLVYYLGGAMVDMDSPVTVTAAIGIGAAVLVLGWLFYDRLWMTSLEHREGLGTVLSLAALVAVTFGLTEVMSGRAAYVHIGALLGTVMAANVWMRILPAQRRMVRALEVGDAPDPSLTARAKQRSGHNTFMAVPLIFIMVSSHFPTTSYGHRWNWLMLMLFVLVGFGARSLMNAWERRADAGRSSPDLGS